MSLPTGFLDEIRNRLSLADVVGRKVLWDKRKSQPGKGDLWAPCPFHHEKTASFHVDDRKGYYYCFGCHEKGDAISFVQKTENVGFMEAIEILATEAGMEMPARDPQAKQKADRRTVLGEVMEQAVQFFRFQLKTQAATDARAYLSRRGLDTGAQERFEIGFAPAGWDNLRLALTGKGVSVEHLVACGLSKTSDKGREPYDVFRNRIMFPIRDARGRCIAFGGRAMDPDDNAKYLNSPETELFDKSRNLYNLRSAREATGRGQPLIVAEGYMDVIALSEAGFQGSVAPLGTAVTENQLHAMWRLSPEPIIALDGDKAGMRAAYRVIDIALPLLEAGKGLRFALMPDGKDPDDLIRSDGPEAVRTCLDAALPMVDLLWQQETEGRTFDSPERRAALDKALRERLQKIKDPSLRRHYGEAVRELLDKLYNRAGAQPAAPWNNGNGGGFSGGYSGEFKGGFSGKGKGARGRRKWNAPEPPSPTAKASMLVSGGEDAEVVMRQEIVLAILYRHPTLVEAFDGQLENLAPRDPDLAALKDVLLDMADRPDDLAEAAMERIGSEWLETLLAARHIAVVPCIRAQGAKDLARMTVAEELAKLEAYHGWKAELREAEEDLDDLADEALTWRLAEAARARSAIGRLKDDNEVDFEIGPNGAHIDREEKSALDSLLATIRFEKGRG